MQRRDLSGRARADKLDPSIIVEDLLHRRGGAQRAAILACERRSSFHPIRTAPAASYLQARLHRSRRNPFIVHDVTSVRTLERENSLSI